MNINGIGIVVVPVDQRVGLRNVHSLFGLARVAGNSLGEACASFGGVVQHCVEIPIASFPEWGRLTRTVLVP